MERRRKKFQKAKEEKQTLSSTIINWEYMFERILDEIRIFTLKILT
jgi:hypothetical protein